MRCYLARIMSVAGIPTGNLLGSWGLWVETPLGPVCRMHGTFRDCMKERLRLDGVYIAN